MDSELFFERLNQLKSIDTEIGWNDLQKPFIENQITDLKALILSGSSENYEGDCKTLQALMSILTNIDRVRKQVEDEQEKRNVKGQHR